MCRKRNTWGLEEKLTSGPEPFPLFLLRNDLLQLFLAGIFPECWDINMEKILYIIHAQAIFFLLELTSHAQMGEWH